MTRDEAIKIWKATFTRTYWPDEGELHKVVDCDVDGFVALGMLKLDEPKSFPQKLRDLVSDTRLVQGDAMERLAGLHLALNAQGLKIVEK